MTKDTLYNICLSVLVMHTSRCKSNVLNETAGCCFQNYKLVNCIHDIKTLVLIESFCYTLPILSLQMHNKKEYNSN